MAVRLIIPGRPTNSGLIWWVLTDAGDQPGFSLSGPRADLGTITVRGLGDPGSIPAFEARVVAVKGLQPDAPYTLRVQAGASSADGPSRTLPRALAAGQPFTIVLGSCYHFGMDREGKYGAALCDCYPPASHRDGVDPIRFRFLCGDQIYLDIPPEGLSIAKAPKPWSQYPEQWNAELFRRFFAASPNLTMADDHEFWNDYPHGNAWQLWNAGRADTPLGAQMQRAFEVFQAALNLDPVQADASPLDAQLGETARAFQFSVPPLDFFALDTRTRRTRFDARQPHFATPEWLGRAEQWLRGLTGPGVLFVSQPLVEEKAGWLAALTHTMGDVNLPDYQKDFAGLWDAVVDAPHDVVIATGDIHYSRLYYISHPRTQVVKAYEVVSSPLVRIPMSPPPDVDEMPTAGQVRWDGRYQQTGWLQMFAHTATPVYATLTFTPRAGGTGLPLAVEVTWWSNNGKHAGAVAVGSRAFNLK